MADYFIGQLMLFPFGFAPKGWALCNGQILQISTNQALFSLLGTTFGGDGVRTFALPDLRGRAAISSGQGYGLNNYVLGQSGGSEQVTLTPDQIAPHTHGWRATVGAANTNEASNNILATATIYATSPPDPAAGRMNAAELTGGGSGQSHENRSPTLTMNWCIALVGIFPPHN